MSELFWEEHPGTGPHLLLVHGFLSSRAQWQPNLEVLANVCRPVVMELYGHGRSPAPPSASLYTTSGYADAIEEIRKSLNVPHWFVCGYSLGAAITIRYALTYPERILGHVFTNSSSAFADRELVASWRTNARQSAEALRAGGIDAVERIAVHPKRARRLPSHIYDALVADAREIKPEGIARAMEHTMPSASVRDEIHTNSRPALLACGRFEKRFAAHREFARTTMPELTICDVDAGHAVNVQGADSFNRAVSDFIRTHG